MSGTTLDELAQAALAAYIESATGHALLLPQSWDMQAEGVRNDWRNVAGAIASRLADPTAAVAEPKPAAPLLDLYREALERLADEDTPVLGEGLGGGAQEELHVRASFAAHALGRDACGCTECRVSLGIDEEDDD